MTDAAQPRLTRFAWLSIAAAVVTIALKTGAWRLTGSVGLLSDALESGVNLVAALMTLWMLALSARPADESHAYGHTKAEYFASGTEGALILLAAASIAWTAVPRLLHPQAIEQAGIGLVISAAASVVNLLVARVLLRAARTHHSIALEADSHHLMTDVWTSVGVLCGIALVALTGWHRLDPIVALLVAANIVLTGVKLVRRSALGLIDVALPPEEQKALAEVLARHQGDTVRFHALRTRQAGARRFASLHVLVPGDWTVLRGHELVEQVEGELRAALHNLTVLTHLEPIEHPSSYEDMALDRQRAAR
ncbi:MAG TPA: cation diffusion facilitator family transporter [Myxococcales bacterium]|nr:cation diffusion facilitator family transporter [Myxococcales bacterium]